MNRPELVRAELRDRVISALTELSYVRDGTGRALKSRRSRSIGAVVPTLRTGIFADGIEALQNRLQENGHTLLVSNSQYDLDNELDGVRTLLEHGVDGIVLVGALHLDETLGLLRRQRLPCVSTYVHQTSSGMPAIGFDNARAAYEVASYMIGLGHRNFGLIVSSAAVNDRSAARRAGTLACLANNGIVLEPDQIVELPYSVASGRAAFRPLIAATPDMTCVICTNDAFAVGVMLEAQSNGLSVPGDLSVTGFDDIDFVASLDPPLTTVHVPAAEIGLRAADHLLATLAGLPVPPLGEIPTKFLVRGSTAKPAGRRTKLKS